MGRDLAVARAVGSAESSPQLLVKRIYIDAELESLLRLAPVVDAIQLDAPHLWLTHRGSGHYDVDDILARLSQSSKPGGNAGQASLRFALYNLVLSGGALDFADQAVGKTHELRDLEVKLPFFKQSGFQAYCAGTAAACVSPEWEPV